MRLERDLANYITSLRAEELILHTKINTLECYVSGDINKENSVLNLEREPLNLLAEEGKALDIITSLMVAQLLMKNLTVWCYDASLTVPLLLQNNKNLVIFIDRVNLKPTLKELINNRVKILLESKALTCEQYNREHSKALMKPIILYMRGHDSIRQMRTLLSKARRVNIFILLASSDLTIDKLKTVNIEPDTTRAILLDYMLKTYFVNSKESCKYVEKIEIFNHFTGLPNSL